MGGLRRPGADPGQAIDAISGFTLVLSSLKIWLEHGIDSQLMYDRSPDAAYN